eukprot:GHVU01006936.1.p1 GENE.GHVU01006936.1~~GHVU01006936.1.p1  ORF type:complete len:109 (+),score=5.05 GHVU01006936.1:224-550(+)
MLFRLQVQPRLQCFRQELATKALQLPAGFLRNRYISGFSEPPRPDSFEIQSTGNGNSAGIGGALIGAAQHPKASEVEPFKGWMTVRKQGCSLSSFSSSFSFSFWFAFF